MQITTTGVLVHNLISYSIGIISPIHIINTDKDRTRIYKTHVYPKTKSYAINKLFINIYVHQQKITFRTSKPGSRIAVRGLATTILLASVLMNRIHNFRSIVLSLESIITKTPVLGGRKNRFVGQKMCLSSSGNGRLVRPGRGAVSSNAGVRVVAVMVVVVVMVEVRGLHASTSVRPLCFIFVVPHSLIVALELLAEGVVFLCGLFLVELEAADAVETLEIDPTAPAHADAVHYQVGFYVYLQQEGMDLV